METETPAEPIIVDEAENQSFLGFKFGALINSEKSVDFQQLRKTLSRVIARADGFECVSSYGDAESALEEIEELIKGRFNED